MLSMWRKTVLLARMVKIEHSIFALPFAYLGMIWAAGGWPGWKIFLTLTVAMVAVRSFAMAVNRLADLPIDAKNPRTQTRPLVTGELGVFETLVFIAVSALIFVGACWHNPWGNSTSVSAWSYGRKSYLPSRPLKAPTQPSGAEVSLAGPARWS